MTTPTREQVVQEAFAIDCKVKPWLGAQDYKGFVRGYNVARADLQQTCNAKDQKICSLEATIAELKTRLEVADHGWDGIACRDETIKLQDKKIAEQAAELESLRKAITDYACAVRIKESRVRDPNFNWSDAEAVDYIDHEEVRARLNIIKISEVIDVAIAAAPKQEEVR